MMTQSSRCWLAAAALGGKGCIISRLLYMCLHTRVQPFRLQLLVGTCPDERVHQSESMYRLIQAVRFLGDICELRTHTHIFQ